MTLWQFIPGAGTLHVTNGIAASKTAAFLAAALMIGTGFIVWRLFKEGPYWDRRRRANLFWIGVSMAGAALNRATVVLFYQGLIDSSSWQPTIGSIIWAVGVVGFARSVTIDYCGQWGWLAVVGVSFLSFFFFG
jgi:hypothetical protein